MSNDFKCPKCNHKYEIAELEMYELYEDNKETEFNCIECETDIIITSIATGWEFDTELRDF